ncbi:unnamed protein product [Adineta ricciae]|uniref:G-protein coupled receptors family 1 profile domain-containing protein n=1 Tax=Adineta ricciae TaxID=249248 RepID=A0A814WZQ7_ADIRI|nr:unnamed protein product [Adineta ricciae]CAF1208298.1 unnamed protein product [Adineta ricciae]
MSFHNQSEMQILLKPSDTVVMLAKLQLVINHSAPVFLIFGTFGFLGNCFTFLHPIIRTNTCSIYLLCGTISDELDLLLNLLPNYLTLFGYTIPYVATSSSMCKFVMFIHTFLPQLSVSFLILALIDRFACSCDLTSKWRQINSLKIVPWMIGLTILYSLLIGIQAIFFYDVTPPFALYCIPTQSFLCSVLYIITSTCVQVSLLSLFVLLIFRNVTRSRKRVNVAASGRMNRQFIRTTVVQVFVTSFLSIQWIVLYSFVIINREDSFNVSWERISIINFIFTLGYHVFYINSVKSFYVSTLSSALYRKTFRMAIKKAFTIKYGDQ